MYIVCVIALPAGVAYNNNAEEALEVMAQKSSWEIKIENQINKEIDNKITTNDIKRADGAIIASEIPIRGTLRFDELPVLECSVTDLIKQPEVVSELMMFLTKNQHG